MKKKNKQPTLSQILKVVNQGFAGNDKRFSAIEHQLINLLGETTFTRNEVNSLRSEMNQRFESVDRRFVNLDLKMDKRFDEVDDKLQNLFNEVDISTDQKLKEFKQKYLTA